MFRSHNALTLLFQNVSLSRVFKLFRALGLRHIVVVNENNEVSRVWKLAKCRGREIVSTHAALVHLHVRASSSKSFVL